MLEFVLLKSFRVDTQMDVLRQTIFGNARLPLNHLVRVAYTEFRIYRIIKIKPF